MKNQNQHNDQNEADKFLSLAGTSLPQGKEHFTKALPIALKNSATETIASLPSTKDSMATFSLQLMEALNKGEINPLDLKIHFKALSMVQEVIKNRMDELAKIECDKHGKKFEYRGFEVATQEMGVQYDYSQTGDIYLEELTAHANLWADKVKERQATLKTFTAKTPMIHPDSGEAFEVYPPIKRSTTTIVLKLQK